MLTTPVSSGPSYEVLKVPVGRKAAVLVLSPLVSVRTHFGKSTMLCTCLEDCPACFAGWGSKYAGYAVVSDGQRRRLLRLTESAARVAEREELVVPGRILHCGKPADRRALQLTSGGVHSDFQPSQALSEIQTLSLVMRLHGLGLLPDGCSREEGIATCRRRAKAQLDKMLINA